jgi:hypothetical protein
MSFLSARSVAAMAPSPDDTWLPCPPGELTRVAQRRRARRRLPIVGAAAAALLLLTLAWQRWPQGDLRPRFGGEPNYGGIVCSDLRSRLGDYVSQRLDAETKARIDEHVLLCPPCQQLLDEALGQTPPRVSWGFQNADRLYLALRARSDATKASSNEW